MVSLSKAPINDSSYDSFQFNKILQYMGVDGSQLFHFLYARMGE